MEVDDRGKLTSRKEIAQLVHSFYDKVRKDDLIGPIFNSHITDWPHHLERLTDFWETNLLFIRKYKGNPIKVHIEVDHSCGNMITQAHFGRWLQLWFETINTNCIGANAELAKNRARNMSTMLFMKMFMAR